MISGLSPLEEEDCCLSLAPFVGQSGDDDDIMLPLDGLGYGAVLSMLGGVRPRVTVGGGGWSIRLCGPALFCLGTLAWCCASLRDICLRVKSPERLAKSSLVLPPTDVPTLAWVMNVGLIPMFPASSVLLCEPTELWHSDPESPRGDTGIEATIWYTGFWKESGARS